MRIKFILGVLAGAFCLALGQPSLQAQIPAPDLLVYKVGRTNSWKQADAHRDPVLGALKGRNAYSGTQTETFYWILDRTSKTMRVVEYYTITDFRGAKKKLYNHYIATFGILGSSVLSFEAPPVDEDDPVPHFMDTMLLSPIKVGGLKRLNWRGGIAGFQDPDLGSMSDPSGEGWFMEGTAAPLTLAPGLVVPDVAKSLAGKFQAVSFVEQFDYEPTVPVLLGIAHRTDSGKQTATLDVPLTVKSRTVAAPASPGANTSNNGLATVIDALEKLGYDLDVPSLR